ncbi:MAG: NnrU family protein [Hyphomicrobium sp.]
MLILVIGLVVFLAVHLVPTSQELRRGLADRFGEASYKVGFAVLSLIGLALIVVGYHKLQLHPGKNLVLFDPPSWTRHVAYLLMLPAMIFLVAAYVPSRIRSALKHPMLVAIKIWALAHLLANGDLASALLFGSFLAYAVYDRISVKRREAPGPLAARTGPPINDAIVVIAGLALYAFMLFIGHGLLIGVPLAQSPVAG